MDLEDQWKLAKIIEQHGSGNLTVLIGCPDAESSQIQAETVSIGDPSLSGPLTNRQLRLHVVHVAEPEAVRIISRQLFDKHITQFLSRVDLEAITQRMSEVRAWAKAGTA